MNKEELLRECELTYLIPSGKQGFGKWDKLYNSLTEEWKLKFRSGETLRLWYKNNKDVESGEVYSSSKYTRQVLDKLGNVITLVNDRVTYKPKKDNIDYQAMYAELYKSMPAYKPEPIKHKKVKDGTTAVISINDWHYGLLSKDYNDETAETVLNNAINRAMEKIFDRNIEKIVLVLNGDLYHYDNMAKTTTRGTAQDIALLPEDMVKGVNRIIVEQISKLKLLANVDVYLQHGNHDEILSIQLKEFLKAWYRNDKNVNILGDSMIRNWCKVYGVTYGFTHDIKIDRAKDLIITEARKYVSSCERFIIKTAHKHSGQMYGDYGMFEIRQSPSLCGSSAWEEQQGFTRIRLLEVDIVNKNNTVDIISVKGD